MSTDGYAQFLRGMGHAVHPAGGCYWFDVFPGVYASFPFDRLLSRAEIASARKQLRPKWLMLRYACPVDQGKPSYRLVMNDAEYGMHSLTSKARNQTRRALENCQCRPLGFEELAVSGLELNLETQQRQGRDIPKDFEEYWLRYYSHAAKADGAEAWGCFVNDRLAAYLISFRMESVSHILIVRSHGALLKYYPNNALLFTYIQHCLAEGLSEVSIGLESLQQELQSLDHFKSGLGFEQLPIGQRIELAWPLKAVYPAVKWLLPLFPETEKFNKLRGVVNILENQPRVTWPK